MNDERIIRIKSLCKAEVRENGQSYARLTARIAKENNGISEGEISLWFQTDVENGKYLTDDRSDAFVVSLMYTAVSIGYEIHSDVPVSSRLLYQLNEYLLPSLAEMLEKKTICVHAPEAKEKVSCENAVGTGYSGGVDGFYTIYAHTAERLKSAPYRPALTHLTVINAGVFEGENHHKAFEKSLSLARSLAKDLGLKAVGIDTNLHLVLDEHYLSVYSIRLCSAALALQKLYGTYFLSSGHSQDCFKMDRNNNSFGDLLTCQMLSTKSLRFIGYGGGIRRVDKIRALANYPVCYSRLHSCFVTQPDEKNCGHCKKCRMDLLNLWALGALDKFGSVYDLEQAEKGRAANIAFLMANSDEPLYQDTLNQIKEAGLEIPQRSRILALQFKRSMDNLKNKGLVK